MPYSVPVSGVPLLMDPPFAGTLVWLGVAIGWRTLRALGVRATDATRLERGVLSAAVGIGLLQYAAFGLGMAGLLTPSAVWCALALLSLLFAREMGRVAAAAVRALGSLRRSPPPGWVRLGMVLLAIPLLLAFLQALCPPTDFDGLAYHLTAPKRWLQAGRMVYLPSLVHTNSPMGVEMLFTLALAVWSDTAAKLIHYFLGLLALLAVFAMGRRLRGNAFGFAAAFAAFFLPKPQPLQVSTLAYVEMGLMLQIVSAALAWLLWSRARSRQNDAIRGGTGMAGPESQNPKSKIQNGSSDGLLWASALCAGFAGSFKLTGAFTGLVLALIVLWELRGEERFRTVALRIAIGYGVVAVLPMTPWLLRALLQTGNPVWPLFSGLLPTRDWSREAGAGFDTFFRYYNWAGGRSWSLAQRKLLRGVVMLVVAGLSVIAGWRVRDREARVLLVTAGVLALTGLWSVGLFFRFYQPLLPLAYTGLLMAFARPLQHSRSVQAGILLLLVAYIGIYIRSFPVYGPDPTWREAPLAAAGRLDRAAYLERKLPIIRLWRFANTHLPPDAHLLATGAAPSYYSDRYCFMPDAFGPARIRTDLWEHFLADLQRDRIGYAVVTGGLESSGPDEGLLARRNEGWFLTRLVREHGALIYESGTDRLYQLDWQRYAAVQGRDIPGQSGRREAHNRATLQDSQPCPMNLHALPRSRATKSRATKVVQLSVRPRVRVI